MEATGTSHNTQLQMFSTFKLENWYLFHNIRTEITSQQRTQQCLHENYSSPHCELNFGSRDQFTCRAREQRPKLKQISTIPAPQKMPKYMDVLAARMYAYVPAIRALPWNSGCRWSSSQECAHAQRKHLFILIEVTLVARGLTIEIRVILGVVRVLMAVITVTAIRITHVS